MGDQCDVGTCVRSPTCTDGATNGDETDLDCGGGCPTKCKAGSACLVPEDCLSGTCIDSKCGAPAACWNNGKDPGETDIDCGGPCPACAVEKNCQQHSDCISLTCIFGVCKVPACDDLLRNADETDIDCGGKKCPKCDDDQACMKPSDCSGAGCAGGKCCKGNACGRCESLPEETCDGIDNDCDGDTDEQLAAGSPCPLQQGVCTGARARCAGAEGWACDAETYRATSDRYQGGVETSCGDGLDNDCDGHADKLDLGDCCHAMCSGRQCGEDGCGGSCGTCATGLACVAGACVTACRQGSDSTCDDLCGTDQWFKPKCDNGCNEDPGSCPDDWAACCPQCTFTAAACPGRTCGANDCNVNCGKCPSGSSCVNGLCTSEGPCRGLQSVGCCDLKKAAPGVVSVWCDPDTQKLVEAPCGANQICGWSDQPDHYGFVCGEAGTLAGDDPDKRFPLDCAAYGL